MVNVTEKDRLERVLFALADPTRRAIYERLLQDRLRVTTLAAPFEISLNSVSKHIQTLERAGLVTRTRSGREHVLAPASGGLSPLTDWLEQTHADWSRRLDAIDRVLTEKYASDRKDDHDD